MEQRDDKKKKLVKYTLNNNIFFNRKIFNHVNS